MVNRKVFFDLYRSNLDPNNKIDQKELSAIDLFLTMFEKDFCMFSVNQWAYIFATTFHETASTFLPIKEAYWLSEDWRKKNLRYYPYYGRGFVQITWKENYSAYSKKLNVDFVKNPDLIMNQSYSWFVLVDGFKYGVFTGKKMIDYINDKKTDYIGARKIINGTDKASLIAGYAKTFEQILKKSLI